MTQESLRRFCRKEARHARDVLNARMDALTRPFPAFDKGYLLGTAHAYEILVKHKLKAKKRHD